MAWNLYEFDIYWDVVSLIRCLSQVLEEEAQECAISVWRQVIFESMAYGEGLLTERMMVD